MKAMNIKNDKAKGFTLVELLTVISIIAILAGILIPTVTTAMQNARHARGVAQLKNYAVAITEYKGEYGYYPMFLEISNDDDEWKMDSDSSQRDFLEEMTGRDEDGYRVRVGGNKRAITFLELSQSEIEPDTGRIVDPFGSDDIRFLIDGDENGRIDSGLLPGDTGRGDDIWAKVLVYSRNDEDPDLNIYTWDIDP